MVALLSASRTLRGRTTSPCTAAPVVSPPPRRGLDTHAGKAPIRLDARRRPGTWTCGQGSWGLSGVGPVVGLRLRDRGGCRQRPQDIRRVDPHGVLVGEVEVLLISGRSGVGKTSVGYEVCDLLQAAGLWHALVDGDNLNAAYPKPAGDLGGTALTETNLGALWANYAAAGQHRMVHVNTVAVLEAPMVVRAVGGTTRVVAVLLTAGDDVVAATGWTRAPDAGAGGGRPCPERGSRP